VSFKIYDNLKNVYKCIEEQVFIHLYIHIYDDRDSSRKYWVWGLLTVILLKDSTLKANKTKQNQTKPNQTRARIGKRQRVSNCFTFALSIFLLTMIAFIIALLEFM